MIKPTRVLIMPFAGIFFLLFGRVAAQGTAESFDRVLSSMDSLTLNQPVEKVYLHTDKPYYAAGDTIWFKAYVVQGSHNWPSTLSGAVYADLIDETDSIVGALKLPLINGLGKGNFVLNARLAEGNYRLRAYTQWMRNGGEEFFYEEYIPIGNTGNERVTAVAGLETDNQGHRHFVHLKYQDAETGRPVTGKDVGYVLRLGKRNYQGKGQTDEAGNLLVDVTGKDSQTDRYDVQTLLYDGAMNSKHQFVIHKHRDSCEVAFFPEGGTLVAGSTNRVAIKVTGPDGMGLQATGELLDGDGKSVAEWQTLHRGMGLLTFVPQAGTRYKAQVHFKEGGEASYIFPEVQTGGYVLSVFANLKTDSVLVRVQGSKGFSGPMHLLVQHNGEVLIKNDLDLSRPVLQSFMPKTLFPGGVSQFTLLDDAGRPLAERIAFIYRPDSLHILAKATSGDRIRDSARIELQVSGGSGQKLEWANLSVSVTDEGKVPVSDQEGGNIFGQLLLRADVRGYIENPGFYFTDVTPEKMDKLDLLLMTQGYRQYVWKDLAAGKLPAVRYATEPLIQSVSGHLVNLRGKAVKNGQIVLFSNKLGTQLQARTDEDGFFSFDNLLMEEGLSFSLQGRNEKGGDRVEVKLDEVPRLPVAKPLARNVLPPLNASFEAFIRQKRKDDQAFHFNGEQNLLDEVEVVARPKTHLVIRGISVPMGAIDYVIHPKASDGDKNLLACLRRWVPGLRIGALGPSASYAGSSIRPIGGMKDNYLSTAAMSATRGGWNGGNGGGTPDIPVPRLISNGREMQLLYNGFNLSSNADDAIRIKEFLLDEESFDPDNIIAVYVKEYTGTGLDGLRSFLYIQTKDGLMWPPFLNWNNVVYKPQGYSLVKEFYSPRYDRGGVEAMQADRRSTIYWNPDLRPDDEGRASFGYFNAATPGTYRVVVEGIGSDGRLGRKVFKYTVSN